MEIKDKNETLQPPPHGVLCEVIAEGSFLIVRYKLPQLGGDTFVDVFLNDAGREVLRTLAFRADVSEPEPPPVVEPSLWQAFKWNFLDLFRSED